jgi:hypothetical protein
MRLRQFRKFNVHEKCGLNTATHIQCVAVFLLYLPVIQFALKIDGRVVLKNVVISKTYIEKYFSVSLLSWMGIEKNLVF